MCGWQILFLFSCKKEHAHCSIIKTINKTHTLHVSSSCVVVSIARYASDFSLCLKRTYFPSFRKSSFLESELVKVGNVSDWTSGVKFPKFGSGSWIIFFFAPWLMNSRGLFPMQLIKPPKRWRARKVESELSEGIALNTQVNPFYLSFLW